MHNDNVGDEKSNIFVANLYRKDYTHLMQEKTDDKEGSSAIVACELSVYYRAGIPSVAAVNLEKAVSLLTIILSALKDDASRALVQKEQNKYQKRLFNGCKCID